jgi:RNA polymerase sigma-70 factor, ECF subfamily
LSSAPSEIAPPTLHDVYRAHFRFVWRSLRRLGVREEDTPDMVQEVFLIVHRKLAGFEGRARMTTWLFAICMRVASDGRRRAHVRREVAVGDEFFDARADSSRDVAQQAMMRKNAEMLEDWLRELPLEQRAAFTLFELEGMSGDDIASLMEVPVGTVRSRLRLARDAIMARLAAITPDSERRIAR